MTREEIIEELGIFEEVSLSTEDLSIEIAGGDSFVGGTEDGYICDYLGNVQYSSIESVVDALMDSLSELEIEYLDFA